MNYPYFYFEFYRAGKESDVIKGIEVPESYSEALNTSAFSTSAPLVENTQQASDQQIEVITIPFEERSHSVKTKLQIELLALQVHSIKREIYARELMILEKERCLTEDEKKAIEKKCDSMFNV